MASTTDPGGNHEFESLRAQLAQQQSAGRDGGGNAGGGDRPPLWEPQPGEELHGRVVERVDRERRHGDQGGTYADLTIARADDSQVAVRCARAVLSRLVVEHGPQPGCEIIVVYHGPAVGQSGRTFHDYAMAVEHPPQSDIPADTAGLPPAAQPQPTAAPDDGLPF